MAVTKVLLSDLVDCGALTTKPPASFHRNPTDRALLEAVLDGLRRRSSELLATRPVPGSARPGTPPIPFPTALKIPRGGAGSGVGKTTFVGAVSEIAPLSTEELLTTVSAATDNLDGIENKLETTVAMDFGRLTLDPEHVLYLFGTPRPGTVLVPCGTGIVRGRARCRDHRRHPPPGESRSPPSTSSPGTRTPASSSRSTSFDGAVPLRPGGGARRHGPPSRSPSVRCDARISSSGGQGHCSPSYTPPHRPPTPAPRREPRRPQVIPR